ncbi:MAG: single-strand DNA-binding protein [Frankiales bacterium]|jgi:single-strand DNA-binding protein|nr:single-strand DNA-binding protein [Frankiales bacterium]
MSENAVVHQDKPMPSAGKEAAEHPFNEVRLVGRVAAPPETREMPSGDLMSTFRVIVPRDERSGSGAGGANGRKGGVDTIECVAWRAGLRRTVNSWHEGDMVAVTGALRRRFWRGEAGATSRHEIEVSKATRVRRASP